MPVAISPIDRNGTALASALAFQRGYQLFVLVIDGAAAVKSDSKCSATSSMRSRGTFLPRKTFSRKGSTSSCFSGPPKETNQQCVE